MSAEVIPFRYAEARDLRTVLVDGEPWFVLNDLCAVLDLTNSRMVAARLPEDDVSLTYVTDSIGREQPTAIVSEAGLYRVVLRSDKPQAEPFIQWVTHDVIPSIRKTGTYGVQKALPQNYADALRELAAQVEATELAKVRIRELEPAASAWASLVEATGDYSVADAAKMLSRDPAIQIGQNTLFRYMGKHGWLYQRNCEWHPYQDKVESGLVTLKTNRPYWDSRRGVDVLPSPTVRITAKGVQKLYRLLGGAEAMVEAS